MKQIECNDEREASKAYKEALALKDLQHRFVCQYKDFFVSWDKEAESVSMGIVMEYYEHGALDKLIKLRRSKGEPIEEQVVRRWLGQLIEALVFVHSRGIIHRDLKPSNAFVTKDFNLLLGDFGVSTIMEDVGMVTRSTAGLVNWIAPEIHEAQQPKYDERSDVWSLGCITLEMVTCGLLEEGALSGILFQVKLNPKVLDDLIPKLQQRYSTDLCEVVKTMLRRSYHQRPTTSALVKVPVIQDCLRLINSSLYEQEESSCSVNEGE
jgi:probable inactive protein kinase-like protein SgK071